MRIMFGPFSSADTRRPLPGFLELRPRDASEIDGIDCTALALEQGIAGFFRGVGPVQTIVVPLDPTLDDMTATLILQNELEGKDRLQAQPFVNYLAGLRSGQRPENAVALETSPEGIFAVLRKEAGDPLSDPARSGRFLTGWSRLASILRLALIRGADPYREILCGEGSPFAEERAFLRKDHEVYERDRAAGECWQLRLPGDETLVPALFLRKPKSSLYKFWARHDHLADGRAGFRFVAVCWGDAPPWEWRFFTDPLDRRPIDSLAAPLKEAEAARDPRSGPVWPWYDGKHDGHALVSSPKGGSRLSEARIIEVVSRWGQRPTAQRGRRKLLLALVALLLVIVVAVFSCWPHIARAFELDP